MIDYRYLNAFLAVAETKNFTRAGVLLGIAQSAVSRQVRLLEESLGKQLLIRSPKKVILTSDGEELMNEAQRFDGWIQDSFEMRPKKIRIGTMPGVLENWLLERLSTISLTNVSHLDISSAKQLEIEKGLVTGKLDLGFVPRKLENELISSRCLFRESFSLISSKEINPREIHRYTWIYGESGGYLAKISKKRPTKTIRVDSISALLKLVESGLGIAVLADHMISNKYRLKRRSLPRLSGEVYLAQLNYQKQPDYLKAFVAGLISRF
ncbi:MAG: hypothetical protein CL678_08210 [Bdellovibrionaceae bacterium]|nr:hypothetical protein [Pseudobdellovibrionaceae bacterium]|tara:strand:- start:164 stop:964 length:801 start_codon:yes stop_codon:yes gene_type:complete